MKKAIMPALIAILLLLLILAGFFTFQYLQKYIPSKAHADLHALLGVSGDQVALYLNEELQEAKGIRVKEQTYLPITWVNENLNERFYWDANEKLLVYALPEAILYADHNTVGSTGAPLIWVTGDQVYLSLGLVANYTDIRLAAYDTGQLKRLYVNNTWGPQTVAAIKARSQVRVKGGIKSPIVAQAEKSEQVSILSQEGRWSKIRTADGYIGYVQNRRLANIQETTPVSTFKAPVYTSISLGKEVCLVWHQVTRMEANNALEDLLADTKGVNVVSPTWYSLMDNKGNYSSFASKEYVDKAHAMGIQVWALVDNFNKAVNTEVLLASTSTRQKLIQNLMKEVAQYGLDGLNLDFEGIKQEAGVHYIQFIRELSVSCRKKGVILSVDNYVPAASNHFYNRKEQGIVADYVVIMGYDEHYTGGEAGPVASIDYVKSGIDNTLKVVPKEKVINGIPFYTRLWTQKGTETTSIAMGIAKAKQWIKDNHVELYWQEPLGQYYGEIDTKEGRKMIWMEDARSIGLKMKLIHDRKLAGVACWKLGLESADVWDAIHPE